MSAVLHIRRGSLTVLVSAVALSAWYGAIGLAGGLGGLELGTATARLPFHSPVFAGIALWLHDEPDSAQALRDRLNAQLRWNAVVPRPGERVLLT